jgi:pentatricopeptide repeat protein
MTLRRSDRAVQLWNEMLAAGRQPTVYTWNAMLHGCSIARDPAALEEMWRRMLAAGFAPDAVCWTTRIFGLMSCGRWVEGVAALNEMGARWQAAARQHLSAHGVAADLADEQAALANLGDIGAAVKPTTVTINAAVVGLLRHRQASAAQSVLRWARAVGIEPNTATFNTLLRSAIREGGAHDALQVFKSMEAEGLRADVFTFAIVLEGLCRSQAAAAATMGSDARGTTAATTTTTTTTTTTAMVADIMAKMEAAGIANVHSYGILIDHLLKADSGSGSRNSSSSSNVQAAHALLAHMATKGVSPSPHINTMFVTHYFAQTPPDLAAVEALWRRLARDGRGSGGADIVLLDRFLKGYARVGDLARMRELLRIMAAEAKAPSWDTLLAVVRALVAGGCSSEAAQLALQALRRQGRLFANGIRGSRSARGEAQFRAYVSQLAAVEELPENLPE